MRCCRKLTDDSTQLSPVISVYTICASSSSSSSSSSWPVYSWSLPWYEVLLWSEPRQLKESGMTAVSESYLSVYMMHVRVIKPVFQVNTFMWFKPAANEFIFTCSTHVTPAMPPPTTTKSNVFSLSTILCQKDFYANSIKLILALTHVTGPRRG